MNKKMTCKIIKKYFKKLSEIDQLILIHELELEYINTNMVNQLTIKNLKIKKNLFIQKSTNIEKPILKKIERKENIKNEKTNN